ncbi:hypothetical protein [Natrinema salinisoli]|uniref:hypothetical protein n=1 Tax=Natrinema salinisoli TaxID=2878535 RepID=UPI001CEFF3F1|nr:hypothetical protein [Natrinema salinisoli]
MDRRRYLALSAVISGTTAGCTSVGGKTSLSSNTETNDSHGLLRFRKDNETGEEIARVQIVKLSINDEERDHYPFRISTWQQEGIRLSSLRLKFRSPPYEPGFSPPGIYLREGHHAEKADLYRDEDDSSTTVVDLPDTSDIGDGSISLQFLLTGDQTQDPQQLFVGAEASLSTDDIIETGYSATGDITIEFP